jgi:uncharacterized protein YdhG (YjbR/CyaY superfamily)
MSSFYCEKCGTAILDTLDGYVTFCEHYPLEEKDTLSPNMKGRIETSKLKEMREWSEEQLKETKPEIEEKWILEFYKETHGFPIYIIDWSEGKFDITRVIKSFISEKIKEAYKQGKKEVINGIATKDILTKEIRREVIGEIKENLNTLKEGIKIGLFKNDGLLIIENLKEELK